MKQKEQPAELLRWNWAETKSMENGTKKKRGLKFEKVCQLRKYDKYHIERKPEALITCPMPSNVYGVVLGTSCCGGDFQSQREVAERRKRFPECRPAPDCSEFLT